MSTSVAEIEARGVAVEVTDDELIVQLADGRRIATPLVWYPRLLHATVEQRQEWEFIGDGIGIHWPSVDEDLSIVGMLRGSPAVGARPSNSA
jgi:hypothetical protein